MQNVNCGGGEKVGWRGRLEEDKTALVTLCDLSKSFNCLDRHHLITKLENFFGFRGARYVGSHNKYSEDKRINFGVPQVSVLGIILFTMYIIHLYHHLLPNTCLIYTGDTTLFVPTHKRTN